MLWFLTSIFSVKKPSSLIVLTMFYSGCYKLDDQQTPPPPPSPSPATIMSASWTVKGIYFIITEHHRSNFWQWQEDKPQRTPSLGVNLSVIVPTQFPSAVAEVANCPSVSILPPFPFNIKALQVLAWAHGSPTRHSISHIPLQWGKSIWLWIGQQCR